mmetsp:Transcript_21922/g.39991  ORF Transcript_21922/g.39991 Transcript_21922/m.39991 type:complete len:222 (-) Transcript_21922:18-683(-)
MTYTSQLYFKQPQTIFAKAEKTDKLYISHHLSSQLYSRGVPHSTHYSPNATLTLRQVHSPTFGKSLARNPKAFTEFSGCSPGPIYKYDLNSQSSKSLKGSFSKSGRSSPVPSGRVSPNSYNPKIQRSEIGATMSGKIISKNRFLENTECFLLSTESPGPAAYSPNQSPSSMKSIISRVGRDPPTRNPSPGPGHYAVDLRRKGRLGKFSRGIRQLDPRKSKF